MAIDTFKAQGGNPAWCKNVIQGFIGSTLAEPKDKWTYHIITRKSTQMGGMRFFSRGINEKGFVANFCETEEVVLTDCGQVYSHMQIRGSIPLYWQQAGPVHPPMLSTSLECSNGPFMVHMERLRVVYGPIWVCNLCSKSKSGEPELSEGWEGSIASNKLTFVNYYHLDFHLVTKGNDFKAVNEYIESYEETIKESSFNKFKVTTPSPGERPVLKPQSKQTGVIRTNCVDCLDRTNAWMTKIGFVA